MPNNHTVNVEDMEDGSYRVHVTLVSRGPQWVGTPVGGRAGRHSLTLFRLRVLLHFFIRPPLLLHSPPSSSLAPLSQIKIAANVKVVLGLLSPRSRANAVPRALCGAMVVAPSFHSWSSLVTQIVNMDKNIPASGGELPAVTCQFLPEPKKDSRDGGVDATTGGEEAKDGVVVEEEAVRGPVEEGGEGSEGRGISKLKAAVVAVAHGGSQGARGLAALGGDAEELTTKAAAVVAVEAFTEMGKARNDRKEGEKAAKVDLHRRRRKPTAPTRTAAPAR